MSDELQYFSSLEEFERLTTPPIEQYLDILEADLYTERYYDVRKESSRKSVKVLLDNKQPTKENITWL